MHVVDPSCNSDSSPGACVASVASRETAEVSRLLEVAREKANTAEACTAIHSWVRAGTDGGDGLLK